jgi:hypothetical protein
LKTVFENIYDRYCPLLYNIALQLCPNEQQAEKILILTFQKIKRQHLFYHENKPYFVDLIKLLVQTAQEELYPGGAASNFKIKQFEKTPLLHKILVEQFSVENYCTENNISRQQALLHVRKEFMLIREIDRSSRNIDVNVSQTY